jgi:hypothetical protein
VGNSWSRLNFPTTPCYFPFQFSVPHPVHFTHAACADGREDLAGSQGADGQHDKQFQQHQGWGFTAKPG